MDANQFTKEINIEIKNKMSNIAKGHLTANSVLKQISYDIETGFAVAAEETTTNDRWSMKKKP